MLCVFDTIQHTSNIPASENFGDEFLIVIAAEFLWFYSHFIEMCSDKAMMV